MVSETGPQPCDLDKTSQKLGRLWEMELNYDEAREVSRLRLTSRQAIVPSNQTDIRRGTEPSTSRVRGKNYDPYRVELPFGLPIKWYREGTLEH